MAAGIAHELNNPLAIIASFADVLAYAVESDDRPAVDDALQAIHDAVARSTRIVTGLRRFARETGRDSQEPVLPGRLFEDALDLTRARIENHGVRLTVSVGSETPVLCNPIDLSQVLINLINNAFDATRDGKDGWIGLEAHDTSDGWVELVVTDSGPGIAPDVVADVFNPFFTTKDVGSGTGLGLSISRGVVEGLGGTLSLREDAPNTTFVIRLPRHEG
jgi:C4-dicarboxylate-specific signal transduction histidine kinase